MTQRLLSIDIREDIVCGVLVSVNQRSVGILNCGVAVIGDRPVSEALSEVLLHVDYKDEQCRVCYGAENFYFRNLTFPFADKKKIEKIIPFELEENIAVPLDTLLIDSLVTSMGLQDSSVITAMVEREFIREQLAGLASLHINPEIIAISHVQSALQLALLQSLSDFILLDVGCHRGTMIVIAAGRIRLLRSMVFDDGSLANFAIDRNSQLVSARRPDKIEETFAVMARAIEHTLFSLTDVSISLPILLTGALSGIEDTAIHLKKNLGAEVLHCDLVQGSVKVGLECRLWRSDLMTSALALALRSGKKQLGFNFRKEEFHKRTSLKKYRKLLPRLGVPALVVLLMIIGYLWNGYILKEKEVKSLTEQNERIFKETLPQVQRIVDPVQQLQVEIRELSKETLGDGNVQADVKMLDLLAEVSVRVPKSLNVHVVRMVADRNGILLRGLTDNFNTVDNLKKVLEKSPYFSEVVISSANLATKEAGIRFELKLQLTKG